MKRSLSKGIIGSKKAQNLQSLMLCINRLFKAKVKTQQSFFPKLLLFWYSSSSVIPWTTPH